MSASGVPVSEPGNSHDAAALARGEANALTTSRADEGPRRPPENPIFHAIEYATRAHRGQWRKGTRVPYIVHPLRAATILIDIEAPDPIVIAAVLHDTLEDTEATVQELRSRFGDEVTELVIGATESNRQAPWEERKRGTIQHLKTASEGVLYVASADKLDNVRSMRRGERRFGEQFWERFHRPRERQAWYYQGVASVLERRAQNAPLVRLVETLREEIDVLFGTDTRTTPSV